MRSLTARLFLVLLACLLAPGRAQTYTVLTGWSSPGGLLLDAFDNVFLTTSNDNRVVIVSPTGDYLGAYYGNAAGGFNRPFGVALLGQSVYVVDTFNNRVVQLSAATSRVVAIVDSLVWPYGIVANTYGNTIYIANTYNHTIVECGTDGTVLRVLAPGFYYPYGLAIDSEQHLYVADTNNNRIVKLASDGTVLAALTVNNTLRWPKGVIVDSSYRLFIADTGNSRVVVINSRGEFLLNLTTSDPGIDYCFGLALNGQEDKLFVSDEKHNRIVVFDLPVFNDSDTFMSSSSSSSSSLSVSSSSTGAPAGVDSSSVSVAGNSSQSSNLSSSSSSSSSSAFSSSSVPESAPASSSSSASSSTTSDAVSRSSSISSSVSSVHLGPFSSSSLTIRDSPSTGLTLSTTSSVAPTSIRLESSVLKTSSSSTGAVPVIAGGSSTLSTGATIGLAAGLGVSLLCCVLLVVYYGRRRRQQQRCQPRKEGEASVSFKLQSSIRVSQMEVNPTLPHDSMEMVRSSAVPAPLITRMGGEPSTTTRVEVTASTMGEPGAHLSERDESVSTRTKTAAPVPVVYLPVRVRGHEGESAAGTEPWDEEGKETYDHSPRSAAYEAEWHGEHHVAVLPNSPSSHSRLGNRGGTSV